MHVLGARKGALLRAAKATKQNASSYASSSIPSIEQLGNDTKGSLLFSNVLWRGVDLDVLDGLTEDLRNKIKSNLYAPDASGHVYFQFHFSFLVKNKEPLWRKVFGSHRPYLTWACDECLGQKYDLGEKASKIFKSWLKKSGPTKRN